MTTEELANRLINSSPKDLSSMTNEELKDLREFLETKSTEISWILKGRAKARAHLQK